MSSDAKKIAGSITRLAVLLFLALGTVAAAATDDVYEAQTSVTGEGAANRPLGFAECLEDVLVKVSGDIGLIDDPRVAALAKEAAPLVEEFRYHDRMSGIPHHDEQGTRDRPYDLIVRFNPPKIDAALRALGREPWIAARPRIVLFLGMRNLTSAYMLTADGQRVLEREALADAAARRGMPTLLPSQAALDRAGLSFETLPVADLSSLAVAAKASGGDL